MMEERPHDAGRFATTRSRVPHKVLAVEERDD